jgi:hypothetical protein
MAVGEDYIIYDLQQRGYYSIYIFLYIVKSSITLESEVKVIFYSQENVEFVLK